MITIENLPIPTEREIPKEILNKVKSACSTFIKERISNLKVFNSKTNELIFGKDGK